MFRFLVFIFIVTNVIGEKDHSHHTHSHKIHDDIHGHGHELPHSQVTPEYLKAFQGFSRNLLQQQNYYDAYETSGVVSYCTLTLGLLLANINEQIFSVRSAGIINALELPREKITNAYSAILDSLLEDTNFKPSSTLYTPQENLVLGPNFNKLHTVKDVLALHGNSEASSYINRQIGINTHHVIVDKLVPHIPPFNTTAAGVFVNTLYYNNNWEIPFTSIGQKPFNTPDKEIQIKTLESIGTYSYYEADHYTSVAVPLIGGKKQVIFVIPKTNIKEYLTDCVKDIFTDNPSNWTKKLIKIQVPYLNLVLGRNYQQQLNALGGNETTSCCGRPDTNETIDINTRHFIQPVVQVISYRLSAEGFEIGVTSGSQVNKIKTHTPIINQTEEQQQQQQQQIKSNEEKIIEINVESDKISRQAKTEPSEIIINKPFFIYLRDNELGAISFTAIRSTFDIAPVASTIPQARHHDISTDFTEETRVHRWNCVPHH